MLTFDTCYLKKYNLIISGNAYAVKPMNSYLSIKVVQLLLVNVFKKILNEVRNELCKLQ